MDAEVDTWVGALGGAEVGASVDSSLQRRKMSECVVQGPVLLSLRYSTVLGASRGRIPVSSQ